MADIERALGNGVVGLYRNLYGEDFIAAHRQRELLVASSDWDFEWIVVAEPPTPLGVGSGYKIGKFIVSAEEARWITAMLESWQDKLRRFGLTAEEVKHG